MRLILLTALSALACPVGASAAISSVYDAPTRTLTVRSDASDPIVVACAAMQVTVNGVPPTASPIPCFVRQLEVTGGPGANHIDLSRAPMAGDGATKGITARARITAGDGDDDVDGRGGVDTCTSSRNEKDRLRGCERIRRVRYALGDSLRWGTAWRAPGPTIGLWIRSLLSVSAADMRDSSPPARGGMRKQAPARAVSTWAGPTRPT